MDFQGLLAGWLVGCLASQLAGELSCCAFWVLLGLLGGEFGYLALLEGSRFTVVRRARRSGEVGEFMKIQSRVGVGAATPHRDTPTATRHRDTPPQKSTLVG